MRVRWVTNAQDLTECIDAWRALPRVGFDTEFIRVRTFYPNVALYQVGHEGECALIDPLALRDFADFRRWLTDPATLLVMHACSEDLEVLQHHLGVLPAAIFDTQMAASFVSREHSLGYQALVRRELNIELPKSETRSDWLQRPLSQNQQTYAAEDVHYLPQLYDRLHEQLVRLGRLTWALQDMQRMRAAATPREPKDYFRSTKDAWRLEPLQLAVFQALCLWREETARRRNRPRSHIVPDDALLDIARRALRVRSEMANLVASAILERHGAELESAIATALSVPANELPMPLAPPLSPQQGELLRALRARIIALAEQLGMAETTLASRRSLEAFIRELDGIRDPDRQSDQATGLEGGWRAEVVLPELRNVVANWRRRAQS